MNAPKNLPAKKSSLIDTEAEDHATETARAVRGESSSEHHHQQHQMEPRHPSDEQPNAQPSEPWQID